VSNWEQFADMIATLAVASFAWISSVVGFHAGSESAEFDY
jgi:hypothetical protein